MFVEQQVQRRAAEITHVIRLVAAADENAVGLAQDREHLGITGRFTGVEHQRLHRRGAADLLEKILLLQKEIMGALMPDAPIQHGGWLANGSAEDPSEVKDESRPHLAQSRRSAP